MRISDWSSDVCSSDLLTADDGAAVRMQHLPRHVAGIVAGEEQEGGRDLVGLAGAAHRGVLAEMRELFLIRPARRIERGPDRPRRDRVDADAVADRSEEQTSELQSLMRNSNAVFCL